MTARDSVDAAPRPEAVAVDLRTFVERHVAYVFRSLRRLGVEDMGLDDAVQQVWIVASKKLPEIRQETARAYLFGIAMRVASDARRAARRLRHVTDDDELAIAADDAPLPDRQMERERARRILDEILDEMSDDLRAVFVLYELEQSTMAEIAETLDVAPGTVASRLRRAREVFAASVKRRERNER